MKKHITFIGLIILSIIVIIIGFTYGSYLLTMHPTVLPIKPPERIRRSVIVVETKEEAEEIIEELKKGGDFATIAKNKSIGPCKEEGGDIGDFLKDEVLTPEFVKNISALKVGEITPPMNTIGTKEWYIYKRTE